TPTFHLRSRPKTAASAASNDWPPKSGPPRTQPEKIYETLIEHFMAAFGHRSTLRVRGIPAGRGIPRINFSSPIFRPERYGQLAIQYNIHGGNAPRNDCWWDESIRQLGQWRSARRG